MLGKFLLMWVYKLTHRTTTNLKLFSQNSDEVLNCFESYKLEDVKVPHRENLESASFFAKYLTSDKVCFSSMHFIAYAFKILFCSC